MGCRRKRNDYSRRGGRRRNRENIHVRVERPPLFSLYRSRHDAVLGGVAAGLAERFGWNTGGLRLVMCIVILFTLPLGLLAYIAAWAILPRSSGVEGHFYHSTRYAGAGEDEREDKNAQYDEDPDLQGLHAHFERIDRRMREMEGFVTSEDYRLRRAFEDLERNGN